MLRNWKELQMSTEMRQVMLLLKYKHKGNRETKERRAGHMRGERLQLCLEQGVVLPIMRQQERSWWWSTPLCDLGKDRCFVCWHLIENFICTTLKKLLLTSFYRWRNQIRQAYLPQILYDYTVEVRNRFKGLDLIDRVPDELWTEVHDIVQEAGIKIIPKKRNAKK